MRKRIFGLTDTGRAFLKESELPFWNYAPGSEHDHHAFMRSLIGASAEITIRELGYTWLSVDDILGHEKCPAETTTAIQAYADRFPNRKRKVHIDI
jgi:hypothetical protein